MSHVSFNILQKNFNKDDINKFYCYDQSTINKLILVAPWLDPGREKTTDFFDFDINQGISKRIKEIHLLYSLDDDNDILKSVKIIENNLKNMKIHKFSNYGHFTFGHMKTDKFPELLDIIKKIWNFQNLNK